MVDPTAFLRAPNPGISAGMMQGLGAASMGHQAAQQVRRTDMEKQATDLSKAAIDSWRSKDMAGYQDRLRQLAAIDPKAADDINKTFSTLNWQNLVETGYRVFAAASSPERSARDKLIDQSIDTLSAGPDHWMTQGLQRIKQLPDNEQVAELTGSVEMLKSLGVYPKEAFGGLDRAKAQKTGAFWIQNDDTGEMQLVTGVFDPITKNFELKGAQTPEGWSLADTTGLTPEQKKKMKIETKRGEFRAKSEEDRTKSIIDDGLLAAESVAGLKRGIELLGSVKTGGYHNVALRAKQIFGIESADEGELSNQLSKAVLSQLRSTFGAAFTEREGARLERIEAGFGKSPATNARLLNQALRMAERKAERAIEKAQAVGDMGTVEDIRELLNYSLSQNADKTTEPDKQNLQNIDQRQASQYPTFKSTDDGLASGQKAFIVDGILYQVGD